MCNLYSQTKPQDAMRGLFKVKRDLTGNLPSMPAIFPDQMAPVVRVDQDGERSLEMMRWGFPPPPKAGTRSVTNVRNVASSFWHPWLKNEWRCLVPVTSFCEYTDTSPKVPHWFCVSFLARPLVLGFGFILDLPLHVGRIIRPAFAQRYVANARGSSSQARTQRLPMSESAR